jgi:hypothetical protein
VATYLLGTACLVDIARGEGPAYEWYRGLEEQEGLFAPNIEISAFSVAAIELQFATEPPATTRESTLRQNLVGLISQFRIDDAIVGATPAVIEYWTQYLNYAIPYPSPGFPDDVLGFEEKLVLATAKAGNDGRGYILVDRKRPVHDELELLVHDPYA